MEIQDPSTPHDSLGLTTSPAHILQPLLTAFHGPRSEKATKMNQTTSYLSAASFLTDDFIPGSLLSHPEHIPKVSCVKVITTLHLFSIFMHVGCRTRETFS